MKRLLLILFCWLGAFASQSAELRTALTQFQTGDFATARGTAQSILLQGRGEEFEAALYLLVKTDIALSDAEQAMRGAERLARAFPQGAYYPYARFALAEAHFLNGDAARSRAELQWCADSSGVARIAERAAEILAERLEFAESAALFPTDQTTLRQEALGSELLPNVMLLLCFPDANDAAPRQLADAFKFASDTLRSFETAVRSLESAYRAIQILDSAAHSDVDLVVYAGDEGSATALALADVELGIPILKLTSTPQAISLLCENMVEFLPSQFTISSFIGKYAANDLGIKRGSMLTPDSDLGRAQAQGFRKAADYGLVFDTHASYPASAGNVRRELYDVMSAPSRMERGGEVVEALLSRSEREKIFGDGNAGEISVQTLHCDTLDSTSANVEDVFFFSLQSDQINNYCSQFGNLPRGMRLVGNSAWLDERALQAQSQITRGMLIGAPLLPNAEASTELLTAFEESTSFDATAWELLGLDAAQFVASVFAKQTGTGADFVQAAREVGVFKGTAVNVSIGATGENQLARILQFDGASLQVIK